MQQDMNQLIKQVEALVYYSQIHPVKGVQPVNMPDHETAWRKAQQWLWDNCEADEMGNYHLKGQPGGQSAGTWVSCSQRFPEDWTTSIIRIKFFKKQITEHDIASAEPEYFVMEDGSRLYYYDCEWLDEAALPDNKEREEQAEWEFVQILKENYEAAKRSDEYHFAGNTKKEAVVETYEDLFEIIKGLPLKRQKVDFSFVNNNKDREIAFALWCSDNFLYVEKGRWDGANDETYNTEQLHEIWEESLTNNK